MKKQRSGTRFMALALSAAVVGSAGTAVAQELEVDLSAEGKFELPEMFSDSGDHKTLEADATIVAVKGSTIYTSQTIDGVEVRFEWVVPDEWVSPEGDGVAYGVFDTIVKLGLEIWDRMTDGDKGGGGRGGGVGGGTTNTCNISVTGATVVVVGNLNCGGTQNGTDGTGTGTGGGGGTRPQ